METDPQLASPPPSALMEALDPECVDQEWRVWSDLSASQRTRAVARLEALDRWRDGRGDLDVVEAAKLADVSVSRFYRIASDWRANPSIAALGIFARARARRPKVSAEVVDRLGTAARQAVLMFGDLSISALVDRTIRLAQLPADAKLPGATKVREIIEAERRRIAAKRAMGQVILFDCVATSMPRADRRPHIAFLCIDEGTGAVLGVAAGCIEAAMSGHAAAAADALRTIKANRNSWPWSNVFSTVRMTAGEDIERISRVVHGLNMRFVQQHFVLERDARRYGRLIRKTVGPRMGRVTFTPSRTVSGEAMATNSDMTPWSDAEAFEALRRAADAHNAAVIPVEGGGAVEPPPHLIEALATITAERS
ncbi:MAG: hypothetical protein ACK4SZ_14345 [Allosphingosinicella sp.]|uniref:hypothetical protein n=1 Tax=Allosphingosinicella sp. TaxID=2823234 RepID=UPI003951F5BC